MYSLDTGRQTGHQGHYPDIMQSYRTEKAYCGCVNGQHPKNTANSLSTKQATARPVSYYSRRISRLSIMD